MRASTIAQHDENKILVIAVLTVMVGALYVPLTKYQELRVGFAGSAIMELMMVLLVLRGGRQQQPMPRRMKVLATVYVLFFASLTAVFVAADWNLFIDPVYDYGGPCGGLEAANDC